MLAGLQGEVSDGGSVWTETPTRLTHGGWFVENVRANVDAWLLAAPTPAAWAFLNIGVVDLGITSQADYETRLAYILDAIHTAWPKCAIRVTRPWSKVFDAQSATMATWIDNVLASRGPWAAVGDDERVWAKGADNGATMYYDNVHYSAAGNVEKENQIRTLMGY